MANRFQRIYHQGSFSSPDIDVYVDMLTGVNYLVFQTGAQVDHAMPLLDRDGKPLVTPVPNNCDE